MVQAVETTVIHGPLKGTTTMFSTTNGRPRTVPVIAALAIAAVLAACSAGGAGQAPTEPPVPAPTAVPANTQAPATPAPVQSEEPGSDLLPIRVELDSTTGQDVYVDILDRSGFLKVATTGQPGDGATVEPYTVQVENIDPRTLRLSWTDYPIDNALSLFVDPAGAGLRFVLVQPAPSGPADAMGEGRILELRFDRDISAGQVESFLLEGLDTPG
jgi:hypothetical protein